jgi:hypothetical protein
MLFAYFSDEIKSFLLSGDGHDMTDETGFLDYIFILRGGSYCFVAFR